MADDEGGSSFKSESGGLLMVACQYRVNLILIGRKVALGMW